MAVFHLKGDIISYVYDNTTTSPGNTNFSTKVGFSSSFSSMSVGSTYTMYISTDDFKSNDITDIIDLLDGVQSTKGYPVIGSKTAPQPPSARCTISNPDKALVFDILYGTETPNLTYNYVSLTIKIIEKISNEVSKFVIEIDYLGANRLSPQRYFERVSSSTRRAGIAGNRSISSLANVIGRNIPKTERFNQMTGKVIGKTIKFNNIKGTNYRLFEVLVSNSDGTSGELNLADVGHGISQCIPLIGSTLTDSVLLCEEAESNLHPAAQARLMTTLLESYSEKDSGGNPLIILETHSEHFLKALLRHLETGEGLSDEDVCVLYVEEQDGRTVVKRIRTKDGEFVDPWPRNRWDDETNPII